MKRNNSVRNEVRLWRAEERHRHRRVLAMCIAASLAVHLLALFSFAPPWAGKPAPVKPVGRRAVSLKLKPRPAGGAPAAARALAAAKAAEAKPAEKAPARPAIYGKEEMARALSRVLSSPAAEKSIVTKENRLKETLADRATVVRAWVSRESAAVEREAEEAEEGAVGYQRVIDLTRCSDFEIGRLMDQYKMEVGYGSRRVTDFNLRFTSEWLLTPGQYKNLSSRAGTGARGRRAPAPPVRSAVVSLGEPADGPERSYLAPSVAAMAAIIAAEERYFSSSKADPDQVERVVLSPSWTFRGAAFAVTAAEMKTRTQGTKIPAAAGGRERPGATGEKGKGVTR